MLALIGGWWFWRRLRLPAKVWIIVVLAVLPGLVMFFSSRPAPVRPVAAAAPLSAAWAPFQRECEAGPSPGQGSPPQGCRCWETHLEAAAIVPAYALDVLIAADIGGAQPSGIPAYTVPENIGNVPIRVAMAGCGLYPEAAEE